MPVVFTKKSIECLNVGLKSENVESLMSALKSENYGSAAAYSEDYIGDSSIISKFISANCPDTMIYLLIGRDVSLCEEFGRKSLGKTGLKKTSKRAKLSFAKNSSCKSDETQIDGLLSRECYDEASLYVPGAVKDSEGTVDDDELRRRLEMADESFSETLLRLIDEKGLTDSEVYNKANVDRRLFSKIRSDKYYKPSKKTVYAFAIALGLDLDKTKELLEKAGFTMSNSLKFDILMRTMIEAHITDVFIVNGYLIDYDLPCLCN